MAMFNGSVSTVSVPVSADATTTIQTVLFGGATYEYRTYNKEDPSFLKKRRDNQYGLMFGATHYVSKEWSVTPQLSLTYNESNTELNEYNRELVSVTVRREF